MIDERELKTTIASNIIGYRKALNLTQAELAEKLNYSDKAISKWERAEAMPDIYILKQLAELFGISLDELTQKPKGKVKSNTMSGFVHKKIIIPLLSALLVWVIATILFSLSVFKGVLEFPHIIFIYALPLTFIVLFVFTMIWSKPLVRFWMVSGIIWTIALSLFFTFNVDNRYLFFIVAAPCQLIAILWLIMRSPKRK